MEFFLISAIPFFLSIPPAYPVSLPFAHKTLWHGIEPLLLVEAGDS
ncbi:MAG: hypothetical protein IJF83_04070 [Methanobrevibacter sp.]|nr:hypothetical protein [Methanobrevibacter sp.]